MDIEGQAVVDLQSLLNFKTITDIAITDSLNHKRRVEGILEAALCKNIEAIHGTSVAEGLGIAAANRSDLSKVVNELGLAADTLVAVGQQLMKGAQTTRPETGSG